MAMGATTVSRSALRSILKNRKYTGNLSVPNTIQPSNVPGFLNRSVEIPGMVWIIL